MYMKSQYLRTNIDESNISKEENPLYEMAVVFNGSFRVFKHNLITA